MNFFNINSIAFQIFSYNVSYVELLGTLFGLISVWLASRANILNWAFGILNEIFLFVLFYQTQLYADMFLQVYFFVVTIIGWHNWSKKSLKNRILSLSNNIRISIVLIILTGTLALGFFIKNIHIVLPDVFTVPASYPFVDSLIMVMSIIATILLARKQIESWVLWISVDGIATVLYAVKEIWFLSAEYLVFLFIASYGLYNWNKPLKND
jgi:nicotinamide mononucleotide transporter